MTHYRLALVGFGHVGKALIRLLLEKETELESRYGITYSVTGIATGRHGTIIAPDGIDLKKLVAEPALTEQSQDSQAPDSLQFIRKVPADVLFENTPVNYSSGQPAVAHIRAALECGMHAITANKGPVVHAYQELRDLAKAKHLRFYFESAVMDGAPLFSLFREALPAANLISLRGVLNSTTNLILTRMEQGEAFEAAVAYCQQIGIAETDPSGDIDGWDAAVKLSALSTVLMEIPLKPAQVLRQGIRQIKQDMIQQARQAGQRWKLVCTAERQGTSVVARVAPELVSPDSPFFGVEGTTSIVEFKTDVLGLLSVIETDPGPHTTAYGLLADFVNAVRK